MITLYEIANQILNKQDADYTLSFSKYDIGEPGLQYIQKRKIINLNRSEFGFDWLDQQMTNLKLNQELTWNSNVKISNKTYHVPMIDFEVGIDSDIIKATAVDLLLELNLQELWFLKSGRSFHAYGFPLLKKQEWYQYLGKLLTLPRNYPCIDTRWIGHSLKRGYSALRWSHKTNRYKQLPTFYFHQQKKIIDN